MGKNDLEVIVDAVLAPSTRLRDFSMRNNRLGAAEAPMLARLLIAPCCLTILRIEGNDLGDDGAATLAAALASNTFILELSLDNNGIGLPGAKAIASALRVNRTLTNLDLSSNTLLADGVIAIAESMRFNRKLRVLTLYFTSDVGEFATSGIEPAFVDALRYSTTMQYVGFQYVDTDGIDEAAVRVRTNSRLLAFACGVVRRVDVPPLCRFLARDGDNAVAHRVAGFLVG